MDHDAVARAMYDRDATAPAFGIELLEAGPLRSVTRMQVRADMCNGLDVIHGGMTFLLADSAMAFASNSENEAAYATSAEIDWLAPATTGQWLTAVAERRAGGGRSALWDITVTASDEPDGDGTTIALFRGRTRKVGRPVVEE
jgi:acyl-CoA thioesterase